MRSLTEAIDTTTPSGRLIFHVFGALGQSERDLIRERTRAGLAAACGRKGGRKPVVLDQAEPHLGGSEKQLAMPPFAHGATSAKLRPQHNLQSRLFGH